MINKIDLEPTLDLTGDIVRDSRIIETLREQGLYGEMIAEMIDVARRYAKTIRVPRVSAKTLEGIEDLERMLHEITCVCGDLL